MQIGASPSLLHHGSPSKASGQIRVESWLPMDTGCAFNTGVYTILICSMHFWSTNLSMHFIHGVYMIYSNYIGISWNIFMIYIYNLFHIIISLFTGPETRMDQGDGRRLYPFSLSYVPLPGRPRHQQDGNRPGSIPRWQGWIPWIWMESLNLATYDRII